MLALEMPKTRLDLLLVQRGLSKSRQAAQALLMAGLVSVDGVPHPKAGTAVETDIAISVAEPPRFVSRGGYKLEHALSEFGIDVTGETALDVGASTGGFTDCLLQRGASKVYAVDVGRGQLAWPLRNDERVFSFEQLNARDLSTISETFGVATIDVSFISLRLVLPAVFDRLKAHGRVITLVKPQFEAGRTQVRKGGVVKDPAVHLEVTSRLLAWISEAGWSVTAATPSPLLGPSGNREFLFLIEKAGVPLNREDLHTMIELSSTVRALEVSRGE